MKDETSKNYSKKSKSAKKDSDQIVRPIAKTKSNKKIDPDKRRALPSLDEAIRNAALRKEAEAKSGINSVRRI